MVQWPMWVYVFTLIANLMCIHAPLFSLDLSDLSVLLLNEFLRTKLWVRLLVYNKSWTLDSWSLISSLPQGQPVSTQIFQETKRRSLLMIGNHFMTWKVGKLFYSFDFWWIITGMVTDARLLRSSTRKARIVPNTSNTEKSKQQPKKKGKGKKCTDKPVPNMNRIE